MTSTEILIAFFVGWLSGYYHARRKACELMQVHDAPHIALLIKRTL